MRFKRDLLIAILAFTLGSTTVIAAADSSVPMA